MERRSRLFLKGLLIVTLPSPQVVTRIPVKTPEDIDREIKNQFCTLDKLEEL